MGSSGRAVIGRSFIWVLRVCYEGVLDTTRFLFVKSFQLPDDGASTGYAQLRSRLLTKLSVQQVQALRTSAESSPVRLFLLLIPVLLGTPQYGIYSDRTVIGDLMETH